MIGYKIVSSIGHNSYLPIIKDNPVYHLGHKTGKPNFYWYYIDFSIASDDLFLLKRQINKDSNLIIVKIDIEDKDILQVSDNGTAICRDFRILEEL